MIQKTLPDTISFLIPVNVYMFSQLLSLYLWALSMGSLLYAMLYV